MNNFFHTGIMYAKSSVANATPQSFGTLQNTSLDFSYTVKDLYGQMNQAVAIGQGPMKITGKAQSANFQARFFNDIFFGATIAAGETLVASNEAGTIPGTPFQITVANAATFVEDLEVIYTATGLHLVKVASAPAAGQYSVNAATGMFTFAAADTTMAVQISYSYTSATLGQKVSVVQRPVGVAPTFNIVLVGGYNGSSNVFKLYSCVASKLSIATKLNDFSMPSFEFQGFANVGGQVLDMSSSEASG